MHKEHNYRTLYYILTILYTYYTLYLLCTPVLAHMQSYYRKIITYQNIKLKFNSKARVCKLPILYTPLLLLLSLCIKFIAPNIHPCHVRQFLSQHYYSYTDCSCRHHYSYSCCPCCCRMSKQIDYKYTTYEIENQISFTTYTLCKYFPCKRQ